MAGTITLWVFGLLCFIVAFAKEAASGAGISLPGPKTRGAQIGVAAVGVLALILGAAVRPNDGAPSGSTLPPTPTTTEAPTTTALPSIPPPATSSAPSAPTIGLPVAWSGRVGIPEGGVDFDQTPPGPASGSGIYASEFTGTSASLRDNISMVHDHFSVWTGQSAPSGAACSDWATTHPDSVAHVLVGSLVCLKTPGGRTALIKIDAISPADYKVDATVTVWSR